jgi:disulfide bond formation protein DsbB
MAMHLLRTLSRRWLNLGGFAICAGLLGFAYYLQFYDGLDPCPLCIFQRVGVILLGLVFLIAALHHPQQIGARIYAVVIAATALAGAGVASRHVWLQHLPPDQVPACGPDLGYMLEILPIAEVIRRVFTASGECANIVWSFLGLSMPVWVLMWFLLLGTLGLIGNWISRPH